MRAVERAEILAAAERRAEAKARRYRLALSAAVAFLAERHHADAGATCPYCRLLADLGRALEEPEGARG